MYINIETVFTGDLSGGLELHGRKLGWAGFLL
jgi:hypothetical protein